MELPLHVECMTHNVALAWNEITVLAYDTEPMNAHSGVKTSSIVTGESLSIVLHLRT